MSIELDKIEAKRIVYDFEQSLEGRSPDSESWIELYEAILALLAEMQCSD